MNAEDYERFRPQIEGITSRNFLQQVIPLCLVKEHSRQETIAQ